MKYHNTSYTAIISMSVHLLVVFLITVGCLQRIAWAQSDRVYFYSGENKIYGRIDSGWMAVEFKENGEIEGLRDLAGMPSFEEIEPPAELRQYEELGIKFINTSVLRSSSDRERLIDTIRSDEAVKRAGHPFYLPDVKIPMILTDEFVVKFKPEISETTIIQLNADYRVILVKKSPTIKNKMVLKVTSDTGQNALAVANMYYESGLTEFAHPNFIVYTESRFVPNDPLYPNQWHLNNTGQGGGTADADIDAEEAWDMTMGNPQLVIAVIDFGVQIQHPDLQPNQFTNPGENAGNNIDDDGNGYIDDVHGWNFYNDTDNTDRGHDSRHGTCVAGLAAARGNNGQGVSGVCPQCTILPIARGNTVNDHAEAFDYAQTMGAHVITNSWGYTIGTPTTAVVENAINDAATNGRGGLGCVILFAMTNENVDNCNPDRPDISALDNVIAVSRATNQDLLGNAGFGDCMDVLGPSRGGTLGLTTTDQTGADGYNDLGDYHDNFGGTSGATPQVAGIAALMLTINEALTRDQVQQFIEKTTDKIDATNANYDPVTGFSNTHGFGRVNGYKALIAIRPEVPLISENFESWPPQGWSIINNGGNCVWESNKATGRTNYAGGSGFSADADSDECGYGSTMDTELRTPVLNFESQIRATLSFVSSYNYRSELEHANVDISTDGGATWVNLLSWQEDHHAYGPGETVNIELTPYVGYSNVVIRFHYYSPGWNWWWQVDKVVISAKRFRPMPWILLLLLDE